MGNTIETVGIATAIYKPEVWRSARTLCRELRERGRGIILGPDCPEVREEMSGEGCEIAALSELADADLVVTLGGDGTLLAVAHHAAPKGTPLLGIDLGSFGFLGAESFVVLIGSLDDVLAGKFEVERRLMVTAKILRDGEPVAEHCGLNEAVIARTDVGHLVRLLAQVNGEPMATYPADGLIISTPTGSTAYALSAGGPIVSPAVESLLITPICSHTLYSRPVVVEPSAVIDVTASSRGKPAGGVSVTLDGQTVIELEPGDLVRVQRAPFDAKLVRVAACTFYERLRVKLHWDAER